MSLLEAYKKYRNTQVTLHGKILNNCVSSDDFIKSTKIIGINKNNEIRIDSPMEKDFIMDFNVYEKYKNNRSAVSEYMEQFEPENIMEKELLSAMVKSETALYHVMERNPEKGTVLLKDVTSKSDNMITLVDIEFSKTIPLNALLFTRLIELNGFCMSSGLAFVFKEEHLQFLLKRSKK